MKDMSIRKKLIVGFSIVLVLMVFICYAGITSMMKVTSGTYDVDYMYKAEIAVGILTVIGVIIGLFVEFQVIRDIRRPVQVLQAATQRLTEGDIEVELTKYGNNELGELTDDIEKLTINTKYQASVAERIASGDLDFQVDVKSSKDVLGNAFAQIVREQNTMLLNIRESAEQVALGADQVSGASQSLAQGATDQASAIQQVTASIDEIAESTRGNAEKAKAANDMVNDVKQQAETGNQQMKDMIIAMQQINEASEGISRIIKVIDDIAFQTNILALNASVEAARAGVHGKGFAVVADEVRNLAGKSAQAASETAEMIEDSVRKVEQGVKLAEETAVALDEIMANIDESVSVMNSIAEVAADQATAVTQIDQAIGQVSQVVQTNSATSQECAAASEQLLNQATMLKEIMNRFRLSSRGSVGAASNSKV